MKRTAIIAAGLLVAVLAGCGDALKGTQGDPGPPGPQGPQGPDLPTGAVIMLREGVPPPAGYSLLGTTIVIVKKPNGQVSSVTVMAYQKN